MVVRVRGHCESRVVVLLREQAGVIVGDLDRLVFEDGVAQWEKILDLKRFCQRSGLRLMAGNVEESRERSGKTHFFFVLVFGTHDALFGHVWPHGRNVDE